MLNIFNFKVSSGVIVFFNYKMALENKYWQEDNSEDKYTLLLTKNIVKATESACIKSE